MKSKETKRQRKERITQSNNGLTMKTRVVQSKKKYSRKNFKININDNIDYFFLYKRV